MRSMLRIILVTILTVSSQVIPAMAQTVVNSEPLIEKKRAQVFLPAKDLTPPYIVEGQVDHKGWSETIRITINGYQVIPDSSRPLPNPSTMQDPSSFAIQCREAGKLQIRMSEEGYSHKDVFAAVVQHFMSCPEVSEVNPIDSVSMEIVFHDGSIREYWASPGVVSMEKGMQTIIRGFERDLENGYSLVFTSANTLHVKPRDYEVLTEELAIARSAEKASIVSREWKVLTPKVALAIEKTREEHE